MLNKLTLDKFDTLSTKIIDLVKDKVSSADQLRDVVELIFDKALSESTFVKMYSSLCVAISNAIPTFNDDQQQDQSFKRILLNQCQREFERGTSLKTVEADECDPALLAQAAIRRKQRFLGNVRFIGELFKDSMLAERIMHTCITHFLQEVVEPLEEDIEALCKLLSTIGTKIDHAAAKRHMVRHTAPLGTAGAFSVGSQDVYFNRMLSMTRNPALSPRARFMILDVVDMRRNRWKPRRQQMEAKPLDEFREEMEKEAAEKERVSNSKRSNGSPRLICRAELANGPVLVVPIRRFRQSRSVASCQAEPSGAPAICRLLTPCTDAHRSSVGDERAGTLLPLSWRLRIVRHAPHEQFQRSQSRYAGGGEAVACSRRVTAGAHRDVGPLYYRGGVN